MAYRAVRCSKLCARRFVHRIICRLPGRQMAGRVAAILRPDRQVVVVVDVARCAGHVGMSIGQQESCSGVVKGSRRPTHRVMARCAIREGEFRSRRWVYRVRRLLPGRQVAS